MRTFKKSRVANGFGLYEAVNHYGPGRVRAEFSRARAGSGLSVKARFML